MTNSNQKGKRGEREWSNFLKPYFPSARRGQQFKGTPDSPDVIVEELPQFHFEVKRVEALSLYPAIRKASLDAGHATPVLAHKRNNKSWVVVMYAEDWVALVQLSEAVKVVRERQELEDMLS